MYAVKIDIYTDDDFGYEDPEFNLSGEEDKIFYFDCRKEAVNALVNSFHNFNNSIRVYDREHIKRWVNSMDNRIGLIAKKIPTFSIKKDFGTLLYHLEDDGALMYSNQWIPLVEKCTLNEKIKLGSLLDKKVGGGQIAHITVDGDFATSEQAWDMLNYIANQGVVYFAYNKRISVCANEHAFIGKSCPHCGGQAVDYFTRIVGYLVPTSAYSKERKMEESQRYLYNLNDSLI